MSIMSPFDLRVEYLKEPVIIDRPRPRFFWKVKSKLRGDHQTAYQIIVSSEPDICLKEIGDVWDSGQVESSSSCHIPYEGEELLSCQHYYWRVRWWNSTKEASPYSELSSFATGFMGNAKFKASWITRLQPESFVVQKTIPSSPGESLDIEYKGIYLRKEFSGSGPASRATIYICGLGYYELYVNGQKIGDQVLDPPWSDYQQIAYYSIHEVGSLIRDKNAIGVILGNGRHIKKYGYGRPKLIFKMEIYYAGGGYDIISSDESWKVSGGSLQENGLYFGENYDRRLEQPGWNQPGFDDSHWEKAEAVKGPPLMAQDLPPVKITDRFRPKKILSPQEGIYIFDFGQNISGWVRLKATGPQGTEIRLRFAELLLPDGNLNINTNGNARATDILILNGQGEEFYEPGFTYHSFRYVELTGFPGRPDEDTLEARFVHSAVERTGYLESPDQLINKIHQCVDVSQRANLMSIPTDCPQRDERHGWLADAAMTMEEACFNFDLAAFYQHFLHLIRLAQKEDGSLPDFVPPYNANNSSAYPADPAWGSAYISLCWQMYMFYGDREILQKHFQSLKNYIEFLHQKSADHLLLGLGKYGDWCQPGSLVPKKTPLDLISTWFYYHDVLIFSDICLLLERQDESREYKDLAAQIKEAFNQAFLEKDQYKAIRQGPLDRLPDQTANALPLYLDMVPGEDRDKVLQNLLTSIINHHDYHLDTGIIGTRFLLDVLSKFGYQSVALKIIKQDSYPGWGYMIKEGATTLWERWEKLTGRGMNSHNRIMFGSVDAWFYKNLAGLGLLEPGWRTFQIKPYIPEEINQFRAGLVTIQGETTLAWQKSDSTFTLELEIPAGSRARLHLPVIWPDCRIKELKEKELIIWEGRSYTSRENNDGIHPADNNQEPVFWLDSGCYLFRMEKI
ncbi:MAG: family 78 glycoside hydrolase catalytic domain [Acidobacteriota bacterium]|nr:family 78 glycoside hydrolase catalytic domain [Acidobacteriota bacterium]